MRTARIAALALAIGLGLAASAQCGPVISAFPYTEGFESAEAWTHGGVGDDWEWGTPAHPQIDGPGEGVKSWCVGGLTGQFYEFDAQNWLMGPCFDFSGLSDPWISFQIFWEVERTYDGMVLQYSLDQGSTWDNVGAANDPENCFDQNWFNTNNIINLDEASPKHGWSGRQGVTAGSCEGGQGSGGWVTASHCMEDLGGLPSVRFRFLFGSGSTCNNFDGIAIDDVYIGEPPPPDLETSYECAGTSVSFSAIDPCATAITWDFGDPASGAANTASGNAVDHTFSDVGTYTVSATVIRSCGQPFTETFPATVLGLSFIGTEASCGLANGSLEPLITGSNGPFTYDWQPGGSTDALFEALLPGTYTLTVSGTDGCPITASGTVGNAGSSIAVEVSHTDVSCGGLSDGSALAQVSGGTAISYVWSPIGGDQAQALGLAGGEYSVTVLGDDGCEITAPVIIAEADVLSVTIDPEYGICAGQSAVLEPEITGGVGPYALAWSPDGPDVSPVSTTEYEVTVTDAAGCTSNVAPSTVVVGAAIVPSLSVDQPSGCTTHCVQFTPGPAGMYSYTFDYGDGTFGDGSAHCYGRQGIYQVTLTVTDDIGCSGMAAFADLVEALPTPTAGFIAPATLIVTENPLRVIDASSGGTHWQWYFDGGEGDDTLRDPLVTFPAIDCYTLRHVVLNDFGCSDTAANDVCMESEYVLYAPNAFTPNGDGFNEVFGLVSSVRVPMFFVFSVFDRWGNEVFTTNDPNEGWTGGQAIDGIYAWNAELRDSEHKLRKASGHVVLLR